MLAIHVATVIRVVAVPISCAVAITSLLTSAAKMASNPASSAWRAIVWTLRALQPTPGITPNPSRSAMVFSFFSCPSGKRCGRTVDIKIRVSGEHATQGTTFYDHKQGGIGQIHRGILILRHQSRPAVGFRRREKEKVDQLPKAGVVSSYREEFMLLSGGKRCW